MIGRISLAVGALSLVALTGVSAQQAVTDTVVRIDHPAGVVVLPSSPYEVSGVVRWMGASEPGRSSLTLEGGRHIWIDEGTQVLANGVPVMMSTLRPGTFVVVRSARPFTFSQRDAVSTAAPPSASDRTADMGAATSPTAMPGTVYRDSGVSVVPPGAPVLIYPPHAEVGIRERESERQAP